MPSTQQDCEVQCPQGAEGEGGQEAVPEVLNSLSSSVAVFCAILSQCSVTSLYKNFMSKSEFGAPLWAVCG